MENKTVITISLLSILALAIIPYNAYAVISKTSIDRTDATFVKYDSTNNKLLLLKGTQTGSQTLETFSVGTNGTLTSLNNVTISSTGVTATNYGNPFAVSESLQHAWIIANNTLARIDYSAGSLVTTVDLSSDADCLVSNAVLIGSYIYATIGASASAIDTCDAPVTNFQGLTLVNINTNTQDLNVDSMRATAVSSMCYNADNTKLFIGETALAGNTVIDVFDTSINSFITTINPITTAQYDGCVSNDETNTVYYASNNQNAVYAINASDNSITTFLSSTSITAPRAVKFDSVANTIKVSSTSTDDYRTFELDADFLEAVPLNAGNEIFDIEPIIEQGVVYATNQTDDLLFIILESITSGGTVAGIDCSLPANANLLICRITEQTGGNIGGVSGIISTGLFNVFTNSGLIDGTDTNPQTNGIGYIILIAGLGVMVAMFYLATGDLRKVPTFIWMISSIALVASFTLIGYIDPTFLVISVIVVVALAAMQIRNSVTTGLDFGGGGNF